MAITAVAMSTLTARLVHEYGLGVFMQSLEQPMDPSTFRDTRLASIVLPSDHFRGAWARSLSPGIYGQVRQISDYDPLTGTITVYPPFSSVPISGSSMEIWFLYDPSTLLYDLNAALKKITARTFVPIYDTAVYSPTELRLTIPAINKSSLEMLLELWSYGGWTIFADGTELATGSHYGTRFVRVDVPLPSDTNVLTLTSNSSLRGGIIIDPDYDHNASFFEHNIGIDRPNILRMYEYPYEKYKLSDTTYAHWTDNYDLIHLTNWSATHDRLLVPRATARPLVCLSDLKPYSVNAVSYGTGIDESFEANEELLLAHFAYNVFARLKSVANMNVENTQWIDAQIARTREIIAMETRDEDMRRRSTRPSSAEMVYTLGDTYLGGEL